MLRLVDEFEYSNIVFVDDFLPSFFLFIYFFASVSDKGHEAVGVSLEKNKDAQVVAAQTGSVELAWRLAAGSFIRQ